jgi:hypothetical protein
MTGTLILLAGVHTSTLIQVQVALLDYSFMKDIKIIQIDQGIIEV